MRVEVVRYTHQVNSGDEHKGDRVRRVTGHCLYVPDVRLLCIPEYEKPAFFVITEGADGELSFDPPPDFAMSRTLPRTRAEMQVVCSFEVLTNEVVLAVTFAESIAPVRNFGYRLMSFIDVATRDDDGDGAPF